MFRGRRKEQQMLGVDFQQNKVKILPLSSDGRLSPSLSQIFQKITDFKITKWISTTENSTLELLIWAPDSYTQNTLLAM